MKEINVFSAFNGMGCIWYALDRVDVKVNKRYSSEVDKHANQANNVAYPDTIQLGNIIHVVYGYCWKQSIFDKAIQSIWISDKTKRKLKKFRALRKVKIDLYVGGSPCQGFSFAGKQLAFDDPRSKLFFEFVRLWNEIKKVNPEAKFLLENVQMKKNELRIISEYMGVFPVNINSNRVSAQNRNRWYWSNIKTKDVGLFAENWTDIPQPEDKGILLKDILQPESEVDSKYYLSGLGANYSLNAIFKQDRPKQIGKKAPCLQASRQDIIKLDKQGNEKTDQNKAGCLTGGGNSGGNHSDMDIICVAMRGRNPDNPSDRSLGAPTEQRLEPNEHGKTNCLTSVAKDNLILAKQNKYIKKNFKELDEKGNALLASSYKGNRANGMTLVEKDYKLRRLTPRECGRLQTFTDKELDILLSSGISDTQLYKMFGNGWTIVVIAHILSFYK